MPPKYVEDEHRIGLLEDVMSHAKEVFEQGLQLEAILLVHEYLEQKLNSLFKQLAPDDNPTIHRKFKQMIDVLRSEEMVSDEEYATLNEFNRLRNVNSNQILDFSLTLRGAKKGDMIKAMNLAAESEQVILRLFQEAEEEDSSKQSKKKKKKKRG